ncbi:MAG: TonB-dependent receptor domain-containing protein, partial [Longimicrobiales bacterium]
YTEDVPRAGLQGIRDGDRISGVPKNTLSASATYRRPFSSTLNGFANGSVQYTSERTDTVDGALPSDATTTVDLRLGIEGESWGAYLFGNNLTDEDGAVEAQFPFTPVTRLRPRTLGVNLRYNFN